MAQRTIVLNGQGNNTIWATQSATTTYYGLVGGPFLVDAKFTSPVNGAYTNGCYQTWTLACVMSRIFHCAGVIGSGHPSIATRINVQGPAGAGAGGNLASVSHDGTQPVGNPSYWYDATDLDAITAGQQIGMQQTLSASTSQGPINPGLGVCIDSVDQGVFAPFAYPIKGAGTEQSHINGAYYAHLCGNSGTVQGVGMSSAAALGQDYSPGGFVASGLQWQNTAAAAPPSGDTFGQTIAAFTYASTWGGTPAVSSLKTGYPTTGEPAGWVGLFIDATDIAAVPAGNYPSIQWSGQAISGLMRIANCGVHIRPAANNATLLLGGTGSTGGAVWDGAGVLTTPPTISPTYTTFGGAPRTDSLYTENTNAIPTAGVISNLYFLTGGTTFSSPGTPTTVALQRGQNTGETVSGGQGGGTISTAPGIAGSPPSNFTDTLTAAVTAASAWTFDATDIAAFTPFNGMLLEIDFPSGTGSGAIQAYAVNFTAPAHLGLTTTGAG